MKFFSERIVMLFHSVPSISSMSNQYRVIKMTYYLDAGPMYICTFEIFHK